MELGSKPLRCYWWHITPNFGDMLSKPLLEHFTGKAVTLVGGGDYNKFMVAGSIIETARPGDIIWGAGHNRKTFLNLPLEVQILAVRGPITKSFIVEPKVPEIFGDPAILLPLLYNPNMKKEYEVGLIPHYADKPLIAKDHVVQIEGKKISGHIIDIQADWKPVIREIKKCELIISSSLHGIIAAEAYGIPAVWSVWGNSIVGGEMKYQDYFLGTGRPEQRPFTTLSPLEDLETKQNTLVQALNTIL
jgi:pyruvyltransferase